MFALPRQAALSDRDYKSFLKKQSMTAAALCIEDIENPALIDGDVVTEFDVLAPAPRLRFAPCNVVVKEVRVLGRVTHLDNLSHSSG